MTDRNAGFAREAQWRHWTRNGTFEISIELKRGSYWTVLWYGDLELGLYDNALTAAETLGTGEHDEALGFKTSELAIPSNPDHWNGLR
jgi:hypothetical protein